MTATKPASKSGDGVSVSRSLQICVLYATTSIVISTLYKLLLSVYHFDAKFFMLSYQLALALLLCMFMKRFLHGIPGLEVPDFKRDVLFRSIAPGVMFTVNMVIGWYGMELVNVPLFLCIRRTTTVFTLLAEWIMLGRVQSLTVQGSVAVIVVGALIAGWESLQSDPLGIGYTLLNNVCTAASMSFTKRFSDADRITGFGILMYNAAIALPLSLVGATLRGEWAYLATFEHIGSATFWASLTAASALGCLMTYVVFLSATVNSPLATSVVGNAKDILGTFVGAIAFHDFKPTTYSVSGICVSFVGAAAFSWAKLAEMRGAAARPAAAAAAAATAASEAAAAQGPAGATAPTADRPAATAPLAPTEPTAGGGAGPSGSAAFGGGEELQVEDVRAEPTMVVARGHAAFQAGGR